jgi:hypothetical protein
MHSNLASFKKPKIQFSQCQDAQTPNKPVSKQPKFTMPTFKTPSFVVSRCCINMRNKKYCKIAEQFVPAGDPAGSSCQLCLPAAAGGYCQLCLTKLFGYKAIIFYTSRDTTKLAFLTLAVLKVGIMNFGCFGFGCVGAGQIGFFGFHYWRF